MTRSIVTLLTDFGSEDTFVGQMKGVILSHCPGATLVDLTHEVPPQSIHAGAYHLAAAWSRFPPRTVHLVIVDPGVGTQRRAIALRYHDHRFVLPDNGLISAVLGDELPDFAVEIRSPLQTRARISHTFHGRDIFSPVAGQLAAGFALDEVGDPIDPAGITRLEIPTARAIDGSIHGEIILVDRFGDCITNIERPMLAGIMPIESVMCGRFLTKHLSVTYQDVEVGEPLALVSSMDTLELAVRDGSAAGQYTLHEGDPVIVNMR